jgi:hypothetical protein
LADVGFVFVTLLHECGTFLASKNQSKQNQNQKKKKKKKMMWITFAPLSGSLMERYNVGAFEINFLSIIYMILYIPFVMPAAWLTDSVGLKWGMFAGSVLNALGAWVRYAGKDPGLFWVLALGQR